MQTIVPLERVWGSLEARVVGARQKWRCNICSEVLPATFELDHITPLWRGGSNCLETNSQLICCSCHSMKTLHENIQRHNRLFAQRRAAVEAARASEPEPEPAPEPAPVVRQLQRKRIQADPVVEDNPFLRFVYIPACRQRKRII